MPSTKLYERNVFIVGGSSGLGKEMAKILAAQGAHITIFARRQHALEAAKAEILAARLSESQTVTAVAADLSDSAKVDSVLRSQNTMADALYCVAGGCPKEVGFLTDIDASALDSCMKSNYFTAAYSAQTMLKIWTENDRASPSKKASIARKIVFVNSAIALIPLPGYSAYAASKFAVRALADTLRMEALRLSNDCSTYTVHCAFPSNFISDSFVEEQTKKPALTKRLEGTTGSNKDLEKKFPSAAKIAAIIIAGAKKGNFVICDSSLESNLFWTSAVGTSPRRGWGIVDAIVGMFVNLFISPVIRWYFDSLCAEDGRKESASTASA